MELKARCCLKCGSEIVGAKGGIKHTFVQYYFSLDNGNYIAVAFCNQCEITEQDYEAVQLALGLDVKIINIARKKNLKDIVLERQGDTCALCGHKIDTTEIEIMTGLNVRHIVCPDTSHSEDTHSNPGKIALDYRQRNKRRRNYIV